MSKLVKCGSPW